MRDCAKKCFFYKKSCENTKCRLFIEYEEDLNCTLVAINKHGNMTLEQIAKRHNVSVVRIKQIIDATLKKIKKPLLEQNTI
tara:strand:+ start:1963 stop:2205 length:243 start_codon:yes stop_codon:yes gene_type:complete